MFCLACRYPCILWQDLLADLIRLFWLASLQNSSLEWGMARWCSDERVPPEERHVTNQDWARLPASQTVFCWFKRPLRLHGNGTAWWESQKVKKYCGLYCFGWCPTQYGVIYQQSCWKLLWDSLCDVDKQLTDPPLCQNSATNQVTIKHMGSSYLTSCLRCCCLCLLPYAPHLPVSISFSWLAFYLLLFCLWSFSDLLHASTHIKWRAAVRFQFRTHLWCCRPPTRSAVAEGTQGSPITALYANVLAPGQQRGHAGTGSLFMQISGRHSTTQSRPQTLVAISPRRHKK